jgi:hypothetical protein
MKPQITPTFVSFKEENNLVPKKGLEPPSFSNSFDLN